MVADSLRGWSDWLYWPEEEGVGGGHIVRGLVIGLIYPRSPGCHLHQLSGRAKTVPVWTTAVVAPTSCLRPPVSHLNEAPTETFYVCCTIATLCRCCCFLLFFLPCSLGRLWSNQWFVASIKTVVVLAKPHMHHVAVIHATSDLGSAEKTLLSVSCEHIWVGLCLRDRGDA